MYDENLGNYFISRLLGTTGTKTICGKCGIIDNDILNYIPKNSENIIKEIKESEGIKNK